MIYLDGELVARAAARIDPADRGLLLGDGLFETLRSYRGSVPWLKRHLARLRDGAERLRIPLPGLDLARGLRDLLEANRLDRAEAAIRVILTRGAGSRGLLPPEAPAPRVIMTADPLPPVPSAPARAITAAIRRNETSPLARLKTLSYLDNVLARLEAEDRGCDEAILLNTAGRVAGAAAANLFVVKGGIVTTPPVSEGVLPGITRRAVLEIVADLGFEAVEAPLEPADLRRADEAFLTNSLIGLRPLAELDGHPIGAGGAAPICQRLLALYRALVTAV